MREELTMVLLPFDCVKNCLTLDPAMVLSGCNVKNVHAAMVAILTEETRTVAKSKREADTYQKETFECVLCKNTKYVFDKREGEIICDRCGVCQRWINPENAEYFSERESKTYVDAENVDADVCDEVHHWESLPGAMLRRSIDELEIAKRRAELPTRGSVTERCIAALLLPYILEEIDIIDIAKRIESGQTLPSASVRGQLAKRFTCVHCKEPTHTYREARHHCRHFTSVGSLVPLKRRSES